MFLHCVCFFVRYLCTSQYYAATFSFLQLWRHEALFASFVKRSYEYMSYCCNITYIFLLSLFFYIRVSMSLGDGLSSVLYKKLSICLCHTDAKENRCSTEWPPAREGTQSKPQFRWCGEANTSSYLYFMNYIFYHDTHQNLQMGIFFVGNF